MTLWLSRAAGALLTVATLVGTVALAGCMTSAAPSAAVAGLPSTTERAAAVRLDFVGGSMCSGYAVAPNVFVTAAHCLMPGAELETMNSLGRPAEPAKLLHTIRAADHAFVVTDYTFTHYAPVVRMDPTLPHQGEKIHYWGNPLGIPDQYREGYVTGYCLMTICFPGLAESMGWTLATQTALLDIMGQRGDSGAGVLNADGELIGTISLIQHRFPAPFVPMGMVAFSFTDAQMAELEAVSGWRP